MRSAAIRLYAPDGVTPLGPLPDWTSLTVFDEFGNAGSYEFGYPSNGQNAHLLSQDEYALVHVADGSPDGWWGVLDADEEDEADSAGEGRTLSVSGPGTLALLDLGIVYPQHHVPGGSVNNLDPRHNFPNATPGKIMRTLVTRAKARGCFPYVTMSFTDTLDSAGNAWPTTYERVYDAGEGLASVVGGMIEAGWCEARMTKLRLDLFVPGAGSVDRPDVVFRIGRNITEHPRARERSRRRTVVLAVGNDGAAAEAAEAGAAIRREGYLGDGNLTHVPTLAQAAQAALAATNADEALTATSVVTDDAKKPRIDYNVGDWVRDAARRVSSTELESLRVASLAVTFQPDAYPTVSLELGRTGPDDASADMRSSINAITRGSLVPARPPAQGDLLSPSAPTTVTISSSTYLLPDGTRLARATVSWTAVTTNTDGSPYTDHRAYYVSLRVDSADYSGETQVFSGTSLVVDSLPPGAAVVARVRAVDTSANTSEYAYAVEHIADVDTTPPQVPSTPAVTSGIGGVRVAWDGLGADGSAMPSDFAHARVHVGTDPAFAATPATMRGQLLAAGSLTVTDLPYGVVHYARIVAVDLSGNESPASAVASGTPRRVAPADADPLLLRNSDHTMLATASDLTGGALAADAAAFDGNKRSAASGSALSGPAYAALRPGRYRATWFLSSTVNAGSTIVATLTPSSPTAGAVTDLTDTAVVASRTHASYRPLSVNFTLTQQAALDFGVAASGGATIAVSHVTVEPVLAAAVAEIGDAEIGNLSVSKLISGTVAADVVIAGQFATALSGARVAFNAMGLRKYAADGTIEVDIGPSSGAVFRGSVIAGTTAVGASRVEITPATGLRLIYRDSGNFDIPVAEMSLAESAVIAENLYSYPTTFAASSPTTSRLRLAREVGQVITPGISWPTSDGQSFGEIYHHSAGKPNGFDGLEVRTPYLRIIPGYNVAPLSTTTPRRDGFVEVSGGLSIAQHASSNVPRTGSTQLGQQLEHGSFAASIPNGTAQGTGSYTWVTPFAAAPGCGTSNTMVNNNASTVVHVTGTTTTGMTWRSQRGDNAVNSTGGAWPITARFIAMGTVVVP